MVALRPQPKENAEVRNLAPAPELRPGQPIKVLSWNIQFLAGKGHVFFFDLPGDKGPDERPTRTDIERTLARVTRLIREEDPDIILLQEVDDHATRTGQDDQLARILALLSPKYSQIAVTDYWRMPFVPHPHIRGSVGTRLVVVSRYRITQAERFALPHAHYPFLVDLFQIQRALLEVHFPIQGGEELVVMNTHLEAFQQNGEVKKRELQFLDKHLSYLDSLQTPWLLAGDFNLLPPGFYSRIPEPERVWFLPGIDMESLYTKYAVLPGLDDLNGSAANQFLTHYPNRPDSKGLDKVIDYQIHSKNMEVSSFNVRQDCLRISDHMPLIGVFLPPSQKFSEENCKVCSADSVAF